MNKKETIRKVLEVFNQQNSPLKLFDAFILAQTGMAFDNFHDLLDEMADHGWLTKKDSPGAGFEFDGNYYGTNDVSYKISIKGIEYLRLQNPFYAILNWLKDNTKISISFASTLGVGLIILAFSQLKDCANSKEPGKFKENPTKEPGSNIEPDTVKVRPIKEADSSKKASL